MDNSTALERGRAAYADRRWQQAFTLLSEARTVDELSGADLDRLATAAILIGRGAEGCDLRAAAFQRHLRAGDVGEAVWCAAWLGMNLMTRQEHAQSSGWFARAQSVLDEHPSLRCAGQGVVLLPAALKALYSGDAETAARTFERIGVIGREFDAPDLIALSRLGWGQSLIALNRPEEGLALLDEAMVAVTVGEVGPIPSGIIYCAVIDSCQSTFDLRRAQEWTAALDRWCAAQPDLVPFSGQCQIHRAELYRLHGAWSEALSAAKLAEVRYRADNRNMVHGALYQQGEVQRLLGDFAAAAESYRQAHSLGFDPQPGMALLQLAQSRPAAGQAQIRRALEDASPVDRNRLLPAAVEIEVAAGDLVTARRAADELLSASQSSPMPLLRAWAETADGTVLLAEGRLREALTRLRAAWRRWLELDVPHEAARCRVQVGRACRALADENSALMEFEAARAVFAELGARSAVQALDALIRPPAVGSAGPLSAREHEVLRLVAEGKSNRAIAAELYLSEKTVARHLSNIFNKLGVTSRSAATAYAYQHALV